MLFIDRNTEQIEKDWKRLEPKDRIILFEKMLKFVLPTLGSVQIENEEELIIDFSPE